MAADVRRVTPDPDDPFGADDDADSRCADLTAAGRHDAAVRLAEQAMHAAPRRAADYDRLARALLGAERFAEAEEAARTATVLEPGGPDRLLTLAEAQAGLGRRDHARRTLLAVLEQDPRHVAAARLLAGLGDPARREGRRGARRSSGNRAMVVPALVMVLIGAVLLLRQAATAAVACLVLAALLLLGGFPGNRSEQR